MERVSAWKRLAGTGKGALGVLDCGAALGMSGSHGIARGREGIILSWNVLNNSTSVWRKQHLRARASWLPLGGPGCLACPHRHGREGTNLYTPKLGSQAQRDQHQPYAETSTVHTPRPLRQREPRPLHPTPGLMAGQGLHPHPTAHWDCSRDGHITTSHISLLQGELWQ